MLAVDVKEIRKTTSEKEVNFLISEGWKLISITQATAMSFQYLLVREGE